MYPGQSDKNEYLPLVTKYISAIRVVTKKNNATYLIVIYFGEDDESYIDKYRADDTSKVLKTLKIDSSDKPVGLVATHDDSIFAQYIEVGEGALTGYSLNEYSIETLEVKKSSEIMGTE